MRLVKTRITNFRSVEDSEEIEIDQLTSLVGKNEAGKTAILQAIAGLNPHPSTPIYYDLERDYPRRFLTEYRERHGKEEAVVVRTEWSLSPDEREKIEEEFGEGTLEDKTLVVLRRYGAKEPEWECPPINFAKALANLMATHALSAAEREPLESAENSDAMREILRKLESPTEHQTKLLQALEGFPGHNLRGAITGKLKTFLPQFMYFSHYDRMAGQIRVDTILNRLTSQVGPPIDSGERVFSIS